MESAGRGHGSTFTITLRAMETSLLDGPVHYLQESAPQTRRARILLVEDHVDTASVLQRSLEKCGYEVRHADSLGSAEALADEHEFDLFISDLGLPDGSGFELMQRLRGKHGLAGIALSGFGMDEDRAASKTAGFAEHFTKPIDPQRLHDAVARLVNSKPDQAAESAGNGL